MKLLCRLSGGLSLLLAGCATSPSLTPTAAPELVGSQWQVTKLADQNLTSVRLPTLTLAEDGRAHGYAGCNRFFAEYQLTSSGLQFSRVGSTRMACDAASNQLEQDYLRGLLQVRHLKQDTDRLQLLDDQAQPLMELTAVPASP